MTRRHALAAVALLAALAAPAAAQPAPVKDTADLFPASTLLFVDVVKPADIAREVTAFTKGTVIEDMNAFMARWHDKRGDGWFPESYMLGAFSAFAGPEAMAEAARMRGLALAVTGIDKKGEPEIVGVILPGQSNVPGFVLRMIMAVDSTMRKAGEVDGVVIFGEVPRNFNLIAPAAPGAAPPAPMAAPKPEAPFIATLPGAIVIGGTLENTSEVVRRLKGKEKRPALSADPAFKESSTLRDRAGIFAYANPARGVEVIEALLKDGPDEAAMIQRALAELLNPKALRGAAANLSLVNGSLELRLTARLAPGQSSPILDLLAGQRASLALLHPVPKDAIAAFSLSLIDGEKQFKRLLAAADTIIGDDGPKPGDEVKRIEAALKASLGKDLFGRIAAVTVAMPAKQELPKGATEVPMLFLTAIDSAAAEQLERLVAPFVSAVAGTTIEPITETINGVKVRSLAAANFPWKAPLHYGRSGATLTLGADRKLVAASLSGKVGDSLAGDLRVTEAMQGHNAAAAGVWRWGNLLPEALADMGQERQWVNGRLQPADPAATRERVEKLRKAHAGFIAQLPPLVVTLSRTETHLELLVQQRNPPATRAKLIEGLFDAVMSGATNIFDNIGNVAPPAPPAPIKN